MAVGHLTALHLNNKMHDKLFRAYNDDNNTIIIYIWFLYIIRTCSFEHSYTTIR